MKKKLLASVFMFSLLAGTTPIFATSHTNTTALNDAQLKKLNQTQTKLTELVTKINGLLATYKNTKNKGLLLNLVHQKKEAKLLNAKINHLIKHPTGNVDKKIDILVKRTAQLEKHVNTRANILNKTQNRTNKTHKHNNTLNITKKNEDKHQTPDIIFNLTRKNQCNNVINNTISS